MKKNKVLWMLTLLFMSIGLSFSQTPRTVSGVVISAEDNLPVLGASLLVKGTTIGGITDADGHFTINNVPADATTLRVTYVGMTTLEVRITSGSMRIVLQPDAEVLEAVVVTGMQRVDKRLFTGAATTLGANDVKLDGIADVSRSLEGRAAGVSVQNVSGTFGSAPKIRIRGATSIYGASKPLWVVDGVIMEDVIDISADALSSGDPNTLISSAIAGLNADDIESFDILKDGSATSIYGARAMAGVIVVTTKKGKAGQSRIGYTGEFTMRLVPSYTEFNIMNSQEQMEVYRELELKGWLPFGSLTNESESGIYGHMYRQIASGALENTEKARNAYLREAEYRNTDWFNLLFDNSLSQNHSVSISNGTDKLSYYASLSAMVDPGWSLQSNVNRYTASLNSSYNLSKWLSLNMIGNASYRQQRAPGSLSSEIDPVFGAVKRDFDINPYSYALNTSRALDPNAEYTRNYAPFNILRELDNNYLDLNVTDLKFQGEMKYKPILGLEFNLLGAIKYSGSSQEHNITEISNQAQAYRSMANSIIRDSNPFLYDDPDDPYDRPISPLPAGGIYQRRDFYMYSYDFRLTANYNKLFKDIHFINVFAGSEASQVKRHNSWFRGYGMQYDMGEIPFWIYEMFKKSAEEGTAYYSLNHDGGTPSSVLTRSVAFFSNATYSYKSKYTLNGTLRYEGTNRLGKTRQARWLPTWNVAGSWNVHEENFFKSVSPTLSNLTLKASYSLTADRGPEFVTNSDVLIISNNPWRPSASDKETGLQMSAPANTELTYEKKHELNIGASFGLYNNRINGTFDWYQRRNYDLIGTITTPGDKGQIVNFANVAGMEASGVELSLSTTNFKTKDFSWTTDFIYGHATNKITKLENIQRIIDLVSGQGFALEGYPQRGLFSIPFSRLNEMGEPVFLVGDGVETSSGIYFQESGKEIMNYLEYSGSVDPTDFGSLGNTLSYKRFRLNVFMTYAFGNVVRLPRSFSSKYSDLSSTPREFKNRWAVPGDENITNIPAIVGLRESNRFGSSDLTIAYNAYNYSNQRIAKGDFIRMKEISLAYDFPSSITGRLMVSNLSLKLQATNLFLVYSDKKLNGQDPEFFNTGGVAVPVPKQITLTLRIGL